MTSLIVDDILYLLMFGVSFYALSGIKFDKLMFVSNPNKARLLIILLSMSLSYLTVQFLKGIIFMLR